MTLWLLVGLVIGWMRKLLGYTPSKPQNVHIYVQGQVADQDALVQQIRDSLIKRGRGGGGSGWLV